MVQPEHRLPLMVQPEHPTFDGTARTSYLWWYSQNILPVMVQPEHPTCDGTARTSYLWWYSQNILPVMVQPEHPTRDGTARTSYMWRYSQNILPVTVQPEHPTCECKYLYCPSTFADQALATTVRWTISENIVPLRYAVKHSLFGDVHVTATLIIGAQLVRPRLPAPDQCPFLKQFIALTRPINQRGLTHADAIVCAVPAPHLLQSILSIF